MRAAVITRPTDRLRDAASLILLRGPAHDPRVLLGRRAASNRFMPGMYVFPGGILQREDFTAGAAGALRADCVARMGVRGDAGRAAALAKAAVRETLEETGVMLGEPGDAGGALTEPGWRLVRSTGRRPALGKMTYLGRALTPTGMPLRFNARFFIAPAAAAHGEAADSDELSDLRWLRPTDWRALPMVSITAYILNNFTAIQHRAATGQAFIYRHNGHRATVVWR